MTFPRTAIASLIFLWAAVPPLHAQFDPAAAYKQGAAVRQRYADPSQAFDTPGFRAGRTDFTSHAEMMDFIHDLQRRSANLNVRILGHSQEGRAIPLLVLSEPAHVAPADMIRLGKPVVFLQGLQHGDEPAGGEAMLALAQQLATGSLRPLLDKVSVLIAPSCNPDGAYYFTGTAARGMNVNRDHIKLDLPETIALHRAINEYQPEVFVDAHEFSVARRWIEKFNAIQSYDFTMLYATNPNVPAPITEMAETLFRRNVAAAVERAGYSHYWYFTTSYDVADKKVSMGGTGPDISRNTAGLANSISFLIETRGVGIGRDSFARRVHTHMVVAQSILETAAQNAAQVMRLTRAMREETARKGREVGPGNEIVVTSRNPVERVKLTMLDPASAQPREVEVDWENSLKAQPVLKRLRPLAYVMPSAYADVARRLGDSGVIVRRLRKPAALEVESYEVTDKRVGSQSDEGYIRAAVTTEVTRKTVRFPAGSYLYSMAQPNANIIAVALEPESPSSFVSLGLVAVNKRQAGRSGGEASEVPIYRMLRPAEIELQIVEPR